MDEDGRRAVEVADEARALALHSGAQVILAMTRVTEDLQAELLHKNKDAEYRFAVNNAFQ